MFPLAAKQALPVGQSTLRPLLQPSHVQIAQTRWLLEARQPLAKFLTAGLARLGANALSGTASPPLVGDSRTPIVRRRQQPRQLGAPQPARNDLRIRHLSQQPRLIDPDDATPTGGGADDCIVSGFAVVQPSSLRLGRTRAGVSDELGCRCPSVGVRPPASHPYRDRAHHRVRETTHTLVGQRRHTYRSCLTHLLRRRLSLRPAAW